MPDGHSLDLARQLRAHLESLQAAGVLFVPFDGTTPVRIAAASTSAVPVEAPPGPTADPFEVRRHELDVLAGTVATCDRCSELFSSRTQPVFGTGPLDAEVMFVGEAPGSDEDAQGEPFVGKGGQLFGRILAACGFTRESVYLCHAIKCRPPKSRPAPTNAECANCRDYFRRQFELVKPKHLVALGPLAARLFTGQNAALAALRGKVHRYREVPLVCTHHPNDIEKDTTGRLKPETWEDMKLLLGAMGRAVPGAK